MKLRHAITAAVLQLASSWVHACLFAVSWTSIPLCLIGLFAPIERALPADYAVVFEKSYRDGESLDPHAYSLIKLRDGGYAFAGRGRTSKAWVVKTASNGDQSWQTFITGTKGATQEARAIAEGINGNLLVAGRTNSRDLVVGNWNQDQLPPMYSYRDTPIIAFAAALDANGQVLWKKLLSPIDGRRGGNVSCAVAVPDGFVLIGSGRGRSWPDQPTSSGKAAMAVLWIKKIDLDGKDVWETTVEEDQGILLDAVHMSPERCTTPLVSPNGEFAFAVWLQEHPSVMKDGVRLLVGPEVDRRVQKHVNVVMKFDSHGRERARKRFDNAVRPQLSAVSNGYVLVDNPMPVLQRGIRRMHLDEKLAIVDQTEIKTERFSFPLVASLPRPLGAMHVAGYYVVPPNERGKPAVALIAPAGELQAIRTFGVLFSDWGTPVALAPGKTDDEIVLLRRGGRDGDVGLLKLKLNK